MGAASIDLDRVRGLKKFLIFLREKRDDKNRGLNFSTEENLLNREQDTRTARVSG